jgi:hypothetical protein
MTVGLSAVNTANAILNAMRGASSAAFGPLATLYVKLHTNAGDPGAAGTANASSVTTRPAINFAAASAGSQAMTGTPPSWTSWAGTNGEVVAHISVHTDPTAGNFQYSATLTAPKTVNTGDTLTLASCTVSLAPIAA